ncbi:hypothetical protein TPB0596_11940 [Tsukamurella pulmonis]|uniref:hypothetical protein n=1 Tax=Tsukamurella pulmonis TaxID=47312 RepID=UPI001EDD62F5|nr:hypothetical protein [Tsukamurella pulmonis]BDD81431.1 hypothetical protein TPB0596_11940 [Tsukamurella pulmonis]
MNGLVWSPQDPAFPEPGPGCCELCGKWTPDGDLCKACDREVHRDVRSEVQQ